MRNVPIEVFQIAKTAVQKREVGKWLKWLGANDLANSIYDPEDNPEEQMLPATDPAFLIAMAAKRCYMSFEVGLNPNVTKVRKDYTEYLDNVLKSGHGSVLEHASYTFAIEGVSRVFTGEMNRHRAGVGISEGSMRYIRYNDIPYWLPTSITLTPEEEELMLDAATGGMTDAHKLAQKKLQTQSIFARVYKRIEEEYELLQGIWKDELAPDAKFAGKKHITSMMRRIIPMGVATGGVWTMNMRAVRHIMALRSSSAAEEEILYVFSKIVRLMVESEPMLCGDFHQDENGYWVPKYPKV